MHPSVERRSALLAAAAGLNSHGVSRSLDGVAKADFFVHEKTGQSHAMRLTLGFLSVLLRSLFPLHEIPFPPPVDAIT
jgi:hypothetical protein